MAKPTPQPINGKQYYDSSQKHLDNPNASLHTHLTENHDSHLVQDLTPQNISSHPYTHAGEAHFSPGVASVNIAATSARPDGTTWNDWAEKHQHQTVLQQHCSYWDKDNDGVIWPLNTYRGCRAWGWHPLLCLLATVIINGGLSYPTGGWLPDPFFRIFLLRVHRDKHGSDSLTYDNQGRFKSQHFEEFMSSKCRDSCEELLWYFRDTHVQILGHTRARGCTVELADRQESGEMTLLTFSI